MKKYVLVLILLLLPSLAFALPEWTVTPVSGGYQVDVIIPADGYAYNYINAELWSNSSMWNSDFVHLESGSFPAHFSLFIPSTVDMSNIEGYITVQTSGVDIYTDFIANSGFYSSSGVNTDFLGVYYCENGACQDSGYGTSNPVDAGIFGSLPQAISSWYSDIFNAIDASGISYSVSGVLIALIGILIIVFVYRKSKYAMR